MVRHEKELSIMNIRRAETIYTLAAHDTIMYLNWEYTYASGNRLSYPELIAGIGSALLLWHEITDSPGP